MSTTRSILTGIITMSLVLAGAIGAALNHLTLHIAVLGIAITCGATGLVIGIAVRRAEQPHDSPHAAELEQARTSLNTVRTMHIARIRACAGCPACRAKTGQ